MRANSSKNFSEIHPQSSFSFSFFSFVVVVVVGLLLGVVSLFVSLEMY